MKTSYPFLLGALIAGLSLVPAERMAAQSFTILHGFAGASDGANPQAGLILSGNTLYGTAVYGGSSAFGYGTVFAVNTDGTGFTNVYSFNTRSGYCPVAGLVLSANTLLSSNTMLYGTAEYGSGLGLFSYGYGSVFGVSTNGKTFSLLHSFTGIGAQGYYPVAGLLLNGTTLYGTTEYGGRSGYGTVFSVNTDGTGFTTLYGFNDGSDGAYPQSGLILVGNALYGTASSGGDFGLGTVFAVGTNGTGFATLCSFTNSNKGNTPIGGLVLSGKTLYGTTEMGGPSSAGTVFAINTDGTGFANLYSFTNGSDGYYPYAGLTLAGNTLYGTAVEGGNSMAGTVFSLMTNGSAFTTLYNFTNGSDGAYPYGGLILSGNSLYGTTYSGGSSSAGTVFALSVAVVQFTANPTVGPAPLVVNFSSPAMDLQSNTLVGWNWTFGDGATSAEQNPSHTYIVPGNYSPSLQATNSSGLVIFESGPPVTVSTPTAIPFTASPTNGVAAFTVHFSSPAVDNAGNALTSWNWTFGDGGSNAAQNPSHTYSVAGTYFPSLIATNNYGLQISGTGPSIKVGPPIVTFTASPTNGAVPLTVMFISAGADTAGNAITNWNWTFGDGASSGAQNPAHIYTNDFTFRPALIATNVLGGRIVGSGPPAITATNAPVYVGLVLNGGFETGDFTGWALSGPVSNNIDMFVDNGPQSELVPHSAEYLAALGAVGSISYLSQTLVTKAGTPYLLSLWLDSPDGQTPNEFLVSWHGNILFDATNIPATGWTNLQYLVSATGTATALQFGFRDDPSYLGIDDVGVWPYQPGIGAIQLSGTNLVLNVANGLSGGTYCLMTSTNAALPLSQWMPVSTNVLGTNGSFSFTVNKPVTTNASQRFYILQLQ